MKMKYIISVYKALCGWKAVMYGPQGAEETGLCGYETREEAVCEALHWAETERLPVNLYNYVNTFCVICGRWGKALPVDPSEAVYWHTEIARTDFFTRDIFYTNIPVKFLVCHKCDKKYKKNPKLYSELPYTYTIIPRTSQGGFFIRVEELPNCMSQGETINEAWRMIQEAMSLWIEGEIEDGEFIPHPIENLIIEEIWDQD